MEVLALVIGIVALVISLLSAIHARRSATAAASSAETAKEALALEQAALREAWIEKLAEALSRPQQISGLLPTLPEPLRRDWKQLLSAASQRNERTPEERMRTLWDRHGSEWEKAALGEALEARTEKR